MTNFNIKFRQRVDRYGTYHYWGMLSITSIYEFTAPNEDWGAVGESEQWTGLCDKYGNEIYVGDILQHWLDNKKELYTGVVVFEKGAFVLKDDWKGNSVGCGSSLWQNRELYENDSKIIGNIGDAFFLKKKK